MRNNSLLSLVQTILLAVVILSATFLSVSIESQETLRVGGSLEILSEEDFMNEDLATLRVKHEVLLSEISMMRIYLLLPDYDTQGIRKEIDSKLYNARLVKDRILELENIDSD